MEPFTVLSLGYAKIPHSTNYPKNRCNREKIQHKLATHGALSYLCRRKVKPTDTHIYDKGFKQGGNHRRRQRGNVLRASVTDTHIFAKDSQNNVGASRVLNTAGTYHRCISCTPSYQQYREAMQD